MWCIQHGRLGISAILTLGIKAFVSLSVRFAGRAVGQDFLQDSRRVVSSG